MNDKDISINTRYPQEIHEKLKELVKQHTRSFNGEVVWALRQYIQREGEKGKDANKSV